MIAGMLLLSSVLSCPNAQWISNASGVGWRVDSYSPAHPRSPLAWPLFPQLKQYRWKKLLGPASEKKKVARFRPSKKNKLARVRSNCACGFYINAACTTRSEPGHLGCRSPNAVSRHTAIALPKVHCRSRNKPRSGVVTAALPSVCCSSARRVPMLGCGSMQTALLFSAFLRVDIRFSNPRHS